MVTVLVDSLYDHAGTCRVHIMKRGCERQTSYPQDHLYASSLVKLHPTQQAFQGSPQGSDRSEILRRGSDDADAAKQISTIIQTLEIVFHAGVGGCHRGQECSLHEFIGFSLKRDDLWTYKDWTCHRTQYLFPFPSNIKRPVTLYPFRSCHGSSQ